jgi:hypothetical protein
MALITQEKQSKWELGVQGFDAADEADKEGLIIVNDGCDSIGLTWGFTQGVDTPASSKFELDADQALVWEVIDASG